MSANGSMEEALRRITHAEDDVVDLRQLMMDEMRAVRVDIKTLTEQLRDTGRAVDLLLAELQLRDRDEDGHG